MSSVVEDALDILRKEEGFEEYPYEDSDGGLTIGYGCNLKQEPLDETEGNWLLLYRVEKRVDGLIDEMGEEFTGMPDKVKSVLIAMAYQMGVAGLMGFKNTLRYMSARDWKLAADEMLDSKWARKDTPARARRMAEVIRKV
jgi:lysozyme